MITLVLFLRHSIEKRSIRMNCINSLLYPTNDIQGLKKENLQLYYLNDNIIQNVLYNVIMFYVDCIALLFHGQHSTFQGPFHICSLYVTKCSCQKKWRTRVCLENNHPHLYGSCMSPFNLGLNSRHSSIYFDVMCDATMSPLPSLPYIVGAFFLQQF